MEYERIGAFTQRLQTEFPSAQILANNSPPEASILNAPEQYIQISNVRPLGDAQALKTAMVPVPEKIARFYEVNDVTRFIYDRPMYKGPIDKDNEFKSLWIERTTLDIASPLPGILRWFEVKQKSVQELTPVEYACEIINNAGKELSDLIVQYRRDPKRNINPFSMRLQGTIDANVMGGISKYQEAFFSEQFLKSPQGAGQQANVQRLKILILEQIQILEQALELHGQLAPAGVQPLHNRLLERFSQLKQSLSGMGRLKRQPSESIVNTPLPPLPTEQRAVAAGAGQQQQPNANYVYELDEIYTRPGDTLRPVETMNSYQTLSKESLSIALPVGEQVDAPPVPNRPRSQNFVTAINGGSIDSPEVPPKRQPLNTSSNAPPLPPRGITPDKRASNPMIFYDFGAGSAADAAARRHSAQQQHGQKYSVVDISFDDPEADQQPHSLPHNLQEAGNQLSVCFAPNDFRDSGISTTSSRELNQLNNLGEESASISMHREHCRISSNGSLDVHLHAGGLNITQRDSSTSSFDVEDIPVPPPPIPPKSLGVTATNGLGLNLTNDEAHSPNTHASLNHSINNHSHHSHNNQQQPQSNGDGDGDGCSSPQHQLLANGRSPAPVAVEAAVSHPHDGGTF